MLCPSAAAAGAEQTHEEEDVEGREEGVLCHLTGAVHSQRNQLGFSLVSLVVSTSCVGSVTPSFCGEGRGSEAQVP